MQASLTGDTRPCCAVLPPVPQQWQAPLHQGLTPCSRRGFIPCCACLPARVPVRRHPPQARYSIAATVPETAQRWLPAPQCIPGHRSRGSGDINMGWLIHPRFWHGDDAGNWGQRGEEPGGRDAGLLEGVRNRAAGTSGRRSPRARRDQSGCLSRAKARLAWALQQALHVIETQCEGLRVLEQGEGSEREGLRVFKCKGFRVNRACQQHANMHGAVVDARDGLQATPTTCSSHFQPPIHPPTHSPPTHTLHAHLLRGGLSGPHRGQAEGANRAK
eukprot:361616-Chlamydomonas_euryale.AAC.1